MERGGEIDDLGSSPWEDGGKTSSNGDHLELAGKSCSIEFDELRLSWRGGSGVRDTVDRRF